MNTFDKILSRAGVYRRPSVEQLIDQSIKMHIAQNADFLKEEARYEKYNQPDYSAYSNQSNLYRTLSWFQSAVNILAQSCALTPFSVKKMVGEDEEDIPNHDFETLLRKPNPMQSRFEFLEAVFSYYGINGNSYFWLNRPSENYPPIEMWTIPVHMIRPIPDEQLYLKGYEFDPGTGKKEFFESWEIVHLKRFNPFSRFIGLSTVEAFAMAATEDLNKQEWSGRLYGENNARTPVILAFADSFEKTSWKTVKEEVKDSAKRNQIMMVQNVGKGGVDILQSSVSQKDMEYLASRKFTKQEIFDMVAPGLFTMTSENATEANARTGRAVFSEYALYPKHVLLAEKITSDILPAYGDNLIGEFDDVRYTDRKLELSEQSEYSKTHTINEVRKEYYGDEPLDDERGDLLPIQIGAEQVGNGEEEPEQEPQVNPFEAFNPQQETEITEEETEENEETEKEEELKKWEKFAISRVGKKSLRPFVCKSIDANTQKSISADLEKAKNAGDIKAVFRKHSGKQSDYDPILAQLDEAVRLLREGD